MTRTDKIALCVIVFLLCASSCMQVFAAYAGDKIWLLLAAKMWLEGQKLYVDIFEVNPPLIIWLLAMPVWVAEHLPPLQDYHVLGLAGLALCALCTWLGVRLIKLHPGFADNRRRRVEFALLLACVFVFFTRPVYFFDREHIFFVLTFPYMLRFMPALARQRTGAGTRLLIGLLAGVGFCLKPYTALAFAGIQLVVMLRERSLAILWSVENGVVYAVSLVYGFCVWHFTPEYIHEVVPMALATYSAFSRRLMEIFYCIIAFITVGLILVDFRPRHATPYRRDIYYFLWVSLILLAYALANNGWGYTFHPLMSQLLFLAGWVMWEYGWLKREHATRGQDVKRFVFGERACAITLLCNAVYLCYCMAAFFATPACEWASECKKAKPYAQYIQDHAIHSFGALSEDFHLWSWLNRLTGARFATRYNALWMVPKLAQEAKPLSAKYQGILNDVGRGLADDFDRRKPEVVFVDDSESFFGYPFHLDLVAFFSGVPEFKAAWSHYRYVSTLDECRTQEAETSKTPTGCRYTIYGRIP